MKTYVGHTLRRPDLIVCEVLKKNPQRITRRKGFPKSSRNSVILEKALGQRTGSSAKSKLQMAEQKNLLQIMQIVLFYGFDAAT